MTAERGYSVMMRSVYFSVLLLPLAMSLAAVAQTTQSTPHDAGTLPVGEDGKPLNTDFETGDLRDWRVPLESD